MKKSLSIVFLAGCLLVAFPTADAQAASPTPAGPAQVSLPPKPTPVPLSPDEELKTFQLPPGYHMELVLSEPEIEEPVVCTFDGDGRMYVAEMRTYMQTIDATNELSNGGRVSRHASTKRDGRFDQHTVFADNLLLPRMVLPLDKGNVMIGQTNTNDLAIFHDTKDAGTADGKDIFYTGGPFVANMEHQPSGLLWAQDNWIYETYNAYRLRWTPKGIPLKETTPANGGQWGVAQDNYGKLFWSNAGSERGIYHFQTPVLYGAIDAPEQFSPDFLIVWPAAGLADFEGGLARVRLPEQTLNHFTGCGGQEIVRVDRLPADLRGNVLLPEPVGRLVRRATVEVKDGITILKNPYQDQHSEFLRSTDPFFRPVFAANGPDGCIYIVDMYRGIIQEGNWVRPGGYLRGVVQKYGLDKVTDHGRIWRLVHDDFKPGPQPRMFEETPAELVAHLEHPNGWWRDQAQRLLVLRQDKSVVPALVAMVRTNPNPLARIHALWTLEGLNAADAKLVREKMKDAEPQVRATAIRVSESLVKGGDLSLKPDVLAMTKDADPSVVLQAIGTIKVLKWPEWQQQVPALLLASKSKGVQEIGQQLLYSPKPFDAKLYTAGEMQLLQKGQGIYQQLCFACHGVDGTGMPMDGQPPGTTLAPPLAGSKTVRSAREAMVSVLLHGVTGPVNGKNYPAQMPAMGEQNDEWIAAVVSFVRNRFGNTVPPVTAADVAAIRAAEKERSEPWTTAELQTILPQPLPGTPPWKATASVHAETAPLAIDGQPKTRFTTREVQTPGQWFQIELPQETAISGVVLDAGNHSDYPRAFKVELSVDGLIWSKPVAAGKGMDAITQIAFAPARAKFIRITQTGSSGKDKKPWSIAEAQVWEPSRLMASTGVRTAIP